MRPSYRKEPGGASQAQGSRGPEPRCTISWSCGQPHLPISRRSRRSLRSRASYRTQTIGQSPSGTSVAECPVLRTPWTRMQPPAERNPSALRGRCWWATILPRRNCAHSRVERSEDDYKSVCLSVTIGSCRNVGSCVDSSQHSVWRCCSASLSALPVPILPVRFPRFLSVSSYS